MRNKTTLQKIVLILLILIVVNFFPALSVIADMFVPAKDFGSLNDNPYLIGWVINVCVSIIIWIVLSILQLCLYVQSGQWVTIKSLFN